MTPLMPRLYGVEAEADGVEGVLVLVLVEVGRRVTGVPATVVVGVDEAPLLVGAGVVGVAVLLDCPLAANLTK